MRLKVKGGDTLMAKRFSILLQVFVLAAVSVIGLMILPATSHACSCAESPSPQLELQQKTAVFSGKVIAVNKPFKLLNWSSADPVQVTFKVDQVWKGDVGKKVTVQTAMSGPSCGFNFQKKQEYLVYAHSDLAHLEVSLCSRTQTLQTSGKDIEALGTPLKSPNEKISGNDSISNKSVMYYILVVGLLVAIILLIIAAKRKKSRS
jgi:hypothetical protein